MTINVWQKAEKLERTNLSPKEDKIIRIKQRGDYWDYLENKAWHCSKETSKYRRIFNRSMSKYINKPFSSFRYDITNSEEYRNNKTMRHFFNKWFIEDGSLKSEFTSTWRNNCYTDSKGIIRKHKEDQTYRRFKWASQTHAPTKERLFEIDGHAFLFKGGIHYMQSSQKPIYITYTDEVYFNVYKMMYLTRQLPKKNYTWVQLNKKQLRDFKLTNI